MRFRMFCSRTLATSRAYSGIFAAKEWRKGTRRVKFRRPFAGNVHPRTRGMHNFSLSDRALLSLAARCGGNKRRRAIKAVEVKSRGFRGDQSSLVDNEAHAKQRDILSITGNHPTRFLQRAKRASVLPCRPRNATANCCTL